MQQTDPDGATDRAAAILRRAGLEMTYLNPLRYFLVIIRGIILKGVGPGVLWPQMISLLVMGLVTLWLASRRFRKTLA